MKDCMLDIETLGQHGDACVVSIGAVAWDADTGEVDDNAFYCVLDVNDPLCGAITPSTVLWWLKQKEAARMAIAEPAETVSAKKACLTFASWARNMEVKSVWANAPTFDVIITRSLFKRCGVKYPFSHRNEVCCRTVGRLARDAGWEQAATTKGVAHNALDDAISQAEWAGSAYRFLTHRS